MDASSPATASPVHGVSPVNWLRAFAYSPQEPHGQVDGHQAEHCEPFPSELNNHDDTLPAQGFRVQSQSRSRRTHAGVSTESARVCASSASGSIPRKRTRRSMVDREDAHSVEIDSNVSPGSLPEDHGPAKTGSRKDQRGVSALVRRTCDMGECGPGTLDTRASHSGNSASSRSSGRVVLDAVEIVRKKKRSKSERHLDPGTIHATSSQHRTHIGRRESGETGAGDSLGSRSLANLDDSGSRILPGVGKHLGGEMEPPVVLKTSKYFTRASTSHMGPEEGKVAVKTPPSSPVLTIPVYIESSDFDHPTFENIQDEPPTEEIVDGGLFDDLMIMLRRLKPILIQESLGDDPWKVLIAVRLLNVTTGKAAIPVFSKIMYRWPTPQALANAPHDELIELLRPLGLYNKRAEWLKDMSRRFIKDDQLRDPLGPAMPTTRSSVQYSLGQFVTSSPVFYYPGVGKYAQDSLRMFCSSAGLAAEDEWKRVMPEDKELIRYLRWRWAFERGKIWYPRGIGVVGDVDVPYLVTLVDELAEHVLNTIDPSGQVYMYHFYNDLCDDLEGGVC